MVAGVPVRTFLSIWLLGVLGAAAVIPYAFTIQRPLLEASPLSLPVIALISIAQSAVLLAFATYVGLRLQRATGFRVMPEVPFVRLALVLGVAAAFLIVLSEQLFVALTPYAGVAGEVLPTWWQGLLASLYGGVAEEILLRLFLMTLFAWILMRTLKRDALSPAVAWSASILAAVVFGLGHLPTMAALMPLSAIVIIRTVTLNAIGGIIFGWLYWKRGLVAAMLAHFSADIVLHVVLPLVRGYFS